MRPKIAIITLSLLLAIPAIAQNECSNLGASYQLLDSLTAKDSGGVTHQVLCWLPTTNGGLLVIPGSPSAGSGTGYSYVAAGTAQTAVSAAYNGTTPGHVVIPPGKFTGSFTPVSNCVIEGSGMGITTVQATSGLALSGLKNVTLRGFTVDGGIAQTLSAHTCAAIPSPANLIGVSNSTNIVIDSVEAVNAPGNAFDIGGADQYIEVRNSVRRFLWRSRGWLR
jgi:hypothetical protein